MATVYLVQHTGIRKQLALKMLSQKMMRIPAVLARFEREAMTAANIDHPNVAAATDYGRADDGRFYLVLEYVEGKELRAVLDASNGPLPPVRALFIARQIVQALTRAHALGVVHRDLKPENIMLVRRDGHDDFVKVLDFGLALVSRHIAEGAGNEHEVPTAPKITQVGEIFGTLAYMAPEQAVCAPTDIRTDLYSVGVILYEMLTGQRPFLGKTPLELIQQQLSTPPPPMKERAAQAKVPADVEAMVQRLLAKQPAERFQTPMELLSAIDTVAAAHRIVWPGAASSSASFQLVKRSQSFEGPWQGLGQGWQGVREKLRRPLVLAASGLLLLLLLPLGFLLHKSGPTEPPSPHPAVASPRPAPPELLAPPGAFDAAVAQGSVGLESLASRFPADPRILRALVLSHSSQHRHREAMRFLAKLAELDQSAGRDSELARILVLALGADAEASQAATTVMEADMGEAGVDLLYDLTIKQTQARWKARLNQSLAKPEVLSRASPATRVALELRSAKTCEAKRALLPEVEREGGSRALAQLKSLNQTQGCGFLELGDCWPCLRKDNTLRDTITAVEGRAR
jgi:serine/threonine-protein kinase